MSSAVADRYARALFELGLEGGNLSALTEQIQSFAASYAASRELSAVLDNPMIDAGQRAAVLADVAQRAGLSGVGFDGVRLLARRKRLAALPEIAQRLAELADQELGVVRATVTSATVLPESFYQNLVSELEGNLKRKVALERKQDPSLIAGVVTRIGDNTVDGSVKGRLAAIERQLSAVSGAS
ncbi:MAG TPA: ATP synthase F1 subunit delta [Polyangiaceae bacterium]|jgi:F-type H+-transporting ATPase subunit delta